MSHKRLVLITGLAPLALLTACNDGEAGNNLAANSAATAPVQNQAVRLAAAADRSWINLSGTVVSTTPNSFVLDYGPNTINVEMDDWDWYQEGRALKPGERVVVTGRVDQDLWENKKIEASSVYVRNLNTYFYANGQDEEDLATSTVYVAAVPAFADSTGYITAIEGQEFTLGSAGGAIRVDTSQLPANARPQLKVGDRVYVWGDLDIDISERDELMAKGIVVLAKDRTKTT